MRGNDTGKSLSLAARTHVRGNGTDAVRRPRGRG
jgi:hypothetical protein